MRRKLGIAAALVVAFAVSGYAQKPDFSGTWTLDAEASGMSGGGMGGGRMGRGMMAGPMTVKQEGDTLTIERQGGRGTMTQSYKLDGSETDVSMGRMSGKATAKWDDNKLVITTKTDMGESTQTWSLDGDTLTIETTGGRGAGKRVYKKSQ